MSCKGENKKVEQIEKPDHAEEKSGRKLTGWNQGNKTTALEAMQVDLDQTDFPIRGIGKKSQKERYLELNKTTSSARRNRRTKIEKQRRKGPDNSSSTTISTVLGDLGRDIDTGSTINEVHSDGDDILVTDREITLAPPPLKNISNRQYVEQKSNKKFSTYDLKDIDDEEYEHSRSDKYKSVKVSIAVQRHFRPLAGLSCGLLGGISLWQCLIMQQWSLPFNVSFMDYIPDYIRPLQSLFYLLATISFVSALDSCDLGHLSGRHFRFCFPCRNAPFFVAAILILTILVSLLGAPLDDQLALSVYNNRSFSYKISPALVSWDIEWWVTMNAVRCAGGILAWLLFSLCLGRDGLRYHLISLLGISKHNEAGAKKPEKKNRNSF